MSEKAHTTVDRSEAGSVKALIDVIHKQQAEISVDIGTRVEVKDCTVCVLGHVAICCM